MIDNIKWIFDGIGTNLLTLLVTIFIVGSASGIAYKINNKKNIKQISYGSGDNIAGDKIINNINKFSDNQSLYASTKPGDYNENLNLDNTAILSLAPPYDNDSVTLDLVINTKFSVENPEFNKNYKNDKDFSAVFPNESHDSVEIKDFNSYDFKNSITFDRFENRTHIIDMGKRKFEITLSEIVDKSTKNEQLIQYLFRIIEQ